MSKKNVCEICNKSNIKYLGMCEKCFNAWVDEIFKIKQLQLFLGV